MREPNEQEHPGTRGGRGGGGFRVADPGRIRDVDLDESAKFIRHGEPDERSAADANKALYGQRRSPNSPFAHRPTSR